MYLLTDYERAALTSGVFQVVDAIEWAYTTELRTAIEALAAHVPDERERFRLDEAATRAALRLSNLREHATADFLLQAVDLMFFNKGFTRPGMPADPTGGSHE